MRHLTRLKAVVSLDIGLVAPHTVADPGVFGGVLRGPNYDADFLQCVEEIVDILRERHRASDSLEDLFVEVEGTCVVQEIGESASRGGVRGCGEGEVLLPGNGLAHREGVVHDYGLEVLNIRLEEADMRLCGFWYPSHPLKSNSTAGQGALLRPLYATWVDWIIEPFITR